MIWPLFPKTVLYFQSLLHVSPHPPDVILKIVKNCRDVFSTLYVGWGEGQATCSLHLVRIFVLSVFKEPQVHNNNVVSRFLYMILDLKREIEAALWILFRELNGSSRQESPSIVINNIWTKGTVVRSKKRKVKKWKKKWKANILYSKGTVLSTLALSYFFTYSAILPFSTYLVQNFHYKIGTCGTHFGETKLVVSIDDKPVSESRSISFIFVSVGTIFCQKKRSNN